MAKTIGRRKRGGPRSADIVSMCAYCGVNWNMSQLRRDAEGHLVCPDEGPGDDALTLDRENASYRPRGPRAYPPAGNYVTERGRNVRVTNAEEIYDPVDVPPTPKPPIPDPPFTR